jgi:hypothetical protein
MSFNIRLLARMTLLPLGAAVLLSGCWTPPNADVVPPGPPRVIQTGIVVKSDIRHAIVQSVDAATRTIVMQVPGTPGARAYKAVPQVPDLGRLEPGTPVRALVSEELTVYVSSDGKLPSAPGLVAGAAPTAKILSLDPSYRVLTLRSPDGGTQTFKVGLEMRLGQMHAGDDVLIQEPQIVYLSVR